MMRDERNNTPNQRRKFKQKRNQLDKLSKLGTSDDLNVTLKWLREFFGMVKIDYVFISETEYETNRTRNQIKQARIMNEIKEKKTHIYTKFDFKKAKQKWRRIQVFKFGYFSLVILWVWRFFFFVNSFYLDSFGFLFLFCVFLLFSSLSMWIIFIFCVWNLCATTKRLQSESHSNWKSCFLYVVSFCVRQCYYLSWC